MTPARESAIQVLRQMHGRRHLIDDALAHRAEQAIADMRLEQG